MRFLTKIITVLFFAIVYMAGGIFNSVFAQCNQNNIYVKSYELRKLDGSPFLPTDPYVVGQTTVNGKLFVELGGNNENGYNLTMIYDIFVNGSKVVNQRQSCLFDNFTQANTIAINQLIPVTDFSWTWGDVVQVQNIFFTWEKGNGKSGTTCAVLTADEISKINAQCYTNQVGFTAVIPLFPKFTFSIPCNSTTVSFQNSTSGGAAPYTYVWDFGGTGTSTQTNVTTQTNPVFTYSEPGTYRVSLTATDNSSPVKLTTKIEHDVVVLAPISFLPSIAPTQINGSSGSIDISVSGGTPPYTYLWTYPTPTYPTGTTRTTSKIESLKKGSYTLTVTDSKGCTKTETFFVNDVIVPDFSYIPIDCINTKIQFNSATTQGGTSQNYSYLWDFGYSTPGATAANPVHTFPAKGDYNVSLTVSDGNTTQKTTKRVTVGDYFTIVIEMEGTRQNLTEGKITVKSITGGTPEYTYSWDGPPQKAGEGRFTSTNRNIDKLTFGTYTLTIKDSKGCTQTFSQVIDIISTLNLDWKSFDISETGEKVGINWVMNAEKEGNSYVIERSIKDIHHFQPIGEVLSQGNSTSPVKYSFTDDTYPLFEPLIYYRVSYNLGGLISYSQVKLVQRRPDRSVSSHWTVYPNPSRDGKIRLKFLNGELAPDEPVLIQAFHGSGLFKSIELVPGWNNEIQLDQVLGSLPLGITVLRVQWNNQSESLKLIRTE